MAVLLADVKQLQPHPPDLTLLPEDGVPVTSVRAGMTGMSTPGTGSESLHLGPASDRVSPPAPVQVSGPFLKLLKQLAQLHVNELAEMRRPSTGERQTSPNPKREMSPRASPLLPSMGHVFSATSVSSQRWRRHDAFELWMQMKRQRSPTPGDNITQGEVQENVRQQSIRSNFRTDFQREISHGSAFAPTPKLLDAAMMINRANLCEVDANRVLENFEAVELASSLSDSERPSLSRLERLRRVVTSRYYEAALICVLLGNVLWMAMHAQVVGDAPDGRMPDEWAQTFLIGDILFDVIFAGEVILRIGLFGLAFWRSCINYIDTAVAIACAIEIVILTSAGPSSFEFSSLRLLRVLKTMKSANMFAITSILAPLHLLVKCLEASGGMLFWSFSLMSVVQCMAAIIIFELVIGFVNDPEQDPGARAVVDEYYGSFTRTMLTMFEVMFANWGPACRVLVDNVSEWFTIFFIIYRCMMGFAVLQVVGAVFVQQALRTASSDDELAFRQREREIQAYSRKVRKLFQSIDGSGDGAITLDEFTKLVQSPKLKFWMSQLELEYHDLLSLFEFLDNGDGQITLIEFIEGAQRLRGGAKALDIWRMETKIEVLFEEVLKMLHHDDGPEEESETMVGNVFQKSSFQHIRSTTHHASQVGSVAESHESPRSHPSMCSSTAGERKSG